MKSQETRERQSGPARLTFLSSLLLPKFVIDACACWHQPEATKLDCRRRGRLRSPDTSAAPDVAGRVSARPQRSQEKRSSCFGWSDVCVSPPPSGKLYRFAYGEIGEALSPA